MSEKEKKEYIRNGIDKTIEHLVKQQKSLNYEIKDILSNKKLTIKQLIEIDTKIYICSIKQQNSIGFR